jgi:hypothetical protein
MTKIEIPEDGWVEIAKVTGGDADAQVEETQEEVMEDGVQVGVRHGWKNDGEAITADVLMQDGKPTRLSVSNCNYDGDFAETAFADQFPNFELNDWDAAGDCVVATVREKGN